MDMRGWIIALSLFAVLIGIPTSVHATSFVITNLASDQPGVAPVTDPLLRNPWGIASGNGSPFWIASNGAGVVETYNGAGVKQSLVVTMPGIGSVTGVAFNSGSLPRFNNDVFLFSLEDGTLAGWRPSLGTLSEVIQTGSTLNVYKGIAIGTIGTNTYTYVANFRTGNIDVLKGDNLAPDLTGRFLDPNLPAGFAPFNIENLDGTIYVTYAVQDAAKFDDVPGAGRGIVDRFDLNGVLLGRVTAAGALNSPWGLALAPSSFGTVAGALLVANNGDGRINAFNPITGAPLGPLLDASNSPLVIDGLWGLEFGSGVNANNLYFTAGHSTFSYGLFGEITTTATAAPEPESLALIGSAVVLLAVLRRKM
jgi:uncharacterized protein (TIGR03118 family)